MAKFNTNLRDSQSTYVAPIAPERFDFGAYADYEARLLERNRAFVEAESDLLVYRRFRADGVFYDICRDRKESLARQLGALHASMDYKADVANFLEPWYGIGYIAYCFGAEYIWLPEQAPSVEPMFASCEELLEREPVPIKETAIGRSILEMTEYFLDKTKGKLPISLTDIQSPLNMLTYLMPVTELFMDLVAEPEQVTGAAELVTGLLIDFLKEQRKLIGGSLASPGHGFASSRAFRGIGISDDTSIMISAEDYQQVFQAQDERLGDEFGGLVYHSCGNWGSKIDMVLGFRNIVAADGAFSPETDPSPNDPALFGERFAGSRIYLNARAVGSAEDAYPVFESLWRLGQKLIAVSYCVSPDEQAGLYDRLHALASVR